MKQLYTFLVTLCLIAVSIESKAQFAVTEIVTDFGGYYKSGSLSINAVKPNNSHNLVAFTYNGVRYSTGVDDALLTSKGLTFSPGDYRALPMETITGAINGNTKIGLGEMYDGITNGPSNPAPTNTIAKNLTDGKKGLDIGTGVANLPAGNMIFPATNMKIAAVGDGIPDLIITQTADPTFGGQDKYEFIDINGARVGNSVDIVLNNILPVGNWTADFYEASSTPLNLVPGFTKTDRAIRLWTADFSAFGINALNVSRVAYFKITLNGNSDVAFVAYNDNTVDVNTSLLPATLKSFTATSDEKKVNFNWETVTEINSKEFVIEASTNGSGFNPVATVAAAGNSFAALKYQHAFAGITTGKWFFRLKMVDINGHATYSAVQQISVHSSNTAINLYPNPASNYTVLDHAVASGNEVIQLFNIQGVMIKNVKVQPGTSQTRIQLNQTPGMYQVKYSDGAGSVVKTLLIK